MRRKLDLSQIERCCVEIEGCIKDLRVKEEDKKFDCEWNIDLFWEE